VQAVSRRLHQARELLAAAEQTAALQRSMRQHDYALNWEAAQALLDSGPNRPAWSAFQGGAEHLLEQLRDSTTSAARLHDTPSAAGRQLQHTRPAHRRPRPGQPGKCVDAIHPAIGIKTGGHRPGAGVELARAALPRRLLPRMSVMGKKPPLPTTDHRPDLTPQRCVPSPADVHGQP